MAPGTSSGSNVRSAASVGSMWRGVAVTPVSQSMASRSLNDPQPPRKSASQSSLPSKPRCVTRTSVAGPWGRSSKRKTPQ